MSSQPFPGLAFETDYMVRVVPFPTVMNDSFFPPSFLRTNCKWNAAQTAGPSCRLELELRVKSLPPTWNINTARTGVFLNLIGRKTLGPIDSVVANNNCNSIITVVEDSCCLCLFSACEVLLGPDNLVCKPCKLSSFPYLFANTVITLVTALC